MANANRRVKSREYKIILNRHRFADRAGGEKALFKLIKRLEGLSDAKVKRQFEPRYRKVWYLDTADHRLFASDRYIVRIRREDDKDPLWKITLKFRSPDRYRAAGQAFAAPKSAADAEEKFEEDITPPFHSVFSRSSTFRADRAPNFETFRSLREMFKRVPKLGIASEEALVPVNGFVAHENSMHLCTVKLPDLAPIKVAVSHWYAHKNCSGVPLISEFSFDVDEINNDESANRLEHFPPETTETCRHIFQSVLDDRAWYSRGGTTKTAFAFHG